MATRVAGLSLACVSYWFILASYKFLRSFGVGGRFVDRGPRPRTKKAGIPEGKPAKENWWIRQSVRLMAYLFGLGSAEQTESIAP
tara:strand:+ start:116 stop:370 length:255 start_codon:yes stop_codon:yes gene_type:complete